MTGLMSFLAGTFGSALLIIVLWDSFEVIILPRRVTRRARLSRLFYRGSWRAWCVLARQITQTKRRERYLGVYGPLSLLVLLAIWATGVIIGFALLHWSLGSAVATSSGESGFGIDLYMSGTTFFTLGLGDVVPRSTPARVLTVIEAGTGFALLAGVIGYLPVVYTAFSRRESNISLLDARASSPSTAAELLRRHARAGSLPDLTELFREWERWSAEVLESHVSYPVLCYFRSQHDNQSWLGSLTTILDAAAFTIAGLDGVSQWQAELTFAMARHSVVDLAQILNAPPNRPPMERLSTTDFERLTGWMEAAGATLRDRADFSRRLTELRALYEPYVHSLAGRLLVTLPPWIRTSPSVDNWRTSAWERSTGKLPRSIFADPGEDEHVG